MKHEEFTVWLSGFLTNRDSLDKKDIETIIKMLGGINKTTPLYDPIVPTLPSWTEEQPFKPPFNPTCDTGKQILKDVYGPGNDDYGRNPSRLSNGDHSVLPPNLRKKM